MQICLGRGSWDGEMVLDYWEGHNRDSWVLKYGRGKQKSGSEKCAVRTWLSTAGFERRKRGRKPKAKRRGPWSYNCMKLDSANKPMSKGTNSPWASSKECHPAKGLQFVCFILLVLWVLCWTSDLRDREVKFMLGKSLNLWQLLQQQQKMNMALQQLSIWIRE